MKVFHIITHIDLGGAERIAINIAKGGRTANIEMHVVEVLRSNSAMTPVMIKEMEEAGIIVHRAPIPLLFRYHYIMEKILAWCFPLWFIWIWYKHRPDVIHSHTEIPDIATFSLCKLFPFIHTKIVRTIHNTKLWSGMEYIGNKIEHFMQRHKANVSISSSVQQCYNVSYHELTPIIYNGIEQVKQQPYTAIKQGKKNICFAGRFEEQKGVKTLCDTVKALKDDTRFHFHVFGSGRLQPLVDELKGIPNASINPPLNNLSSFLSSFDYVFMPSLHEGLATLSIEASFAHTLVLANRADGLIDTLPEDWPLTVNDNNLEQWINLFTNTLPNIDYDGLATTALRHTLKFFTLEKMQEQYFKFYTNSQL